MPQKNPLLKIIYANKEDLLDQVQALIAAGADPSECTEYFETPLRVSSNNGRFDVVEYLFEAGADPSHLNWTPLFHAIAYGSLGDIKATIDEGVDIHTRDTWERTPILLAVQAGDIEKVCCLIDAGADITDLGRCNQSALEYAIKMDDDRMLRYLIGQGFGIEDYNDFGLTPLMQAAEDGALLCVRCLLEHGADIYRKDRSQFSQETAIAHASTLEIAEILAHAGDDLNHMESEVRANLLGLDEERALTITRQDYLAQKHRVFGLSNPQKCELSFWYDMVRCYAHAWKARSQFEDTDGCGDKPVWCYQRFGKSITAIGNGEFVEIAGEHEDSYDPDFCIYNEVFHHEGDGEFTIYQYPEDIFPPTDFHTATLVNGFIYIIGNLGYYGKREYGTTPVYRLNTRNFRIEKLGTTGECPGWISQHTAELKGHAVIRIQGGDIYESVNEKEKHRYNTFDFELNIESLQWSRHEHQPKTGIPPFFPEEYKRFCHNDGSLLAVEDNQQWRLINIIAVHRIDVAKGQAIRFVEETLTASSDDFLFAVAYTISETFDTLEQLEKAAENSSSIREDSFKVCRTTEFPKNTRFVGFSEFGTENRDSFKAWKESFDQGCEVIL